MPMIDQLTDCEIAVVGTGAVGLTAACCLAERFTKVVLIGDISIPDWRPQDDYGLRVSALNPASIELLKTLDVWQQVRSMRVCPYYSMYVWEQNTSTHIEFSSRETSHASLGAIVENQVLLAALKNKVDQCSNITCIEKTGLDNMSAISGAGMLLELGNGKRLTAELVLGADGHHSKVRDCIGASSIRTPYRQMGIVCTIATQLDHQHTAWQCFTRHGPLALLPLDENICSVVWSVPEDKCRQLMELPISQFNLELTEHFESRLGQLEVISELRSFPLQGAQSSSYIGHRAILLGDAAHVIHPLAGLGLNMGLMDAQFLSQLLNNSDRPLGSERVLRRYERARKSENILMQKSLESIDMLFREKRGLAMHARSVGVNFTNKLLPVKMLFMRRALGMPV